MAENSIIIIEPKKGWQAINWEELKEYKDLLFFLVWRDVKVLYKQTILGFAWAILRPVFSMIIFSIVFGLLAKIPSDNIPYPIFTYTALVPWTYFSTSMTKSTQSLISNSNLLTKVYFPRLIIPMTPVLSGLVDFIIAISLMFVFMIIYKIVPTANIVFLPLLIFMMILTASGIGMWLSALAIQYRDVGQVVHFLSQLLMYVAPVIWPISLIPDRYRIIYALYPMTGVIEGFRSSLINTNPMPWDLIITGMISSIVIALSGAFYFNRKERIFSDVA